MKSPSANRVETSIAPFAPALPLVLSPVAAALGCGASSGAAVARIAGNIRIGSIAEGTPGFLAAASLASASICWSALNWRAR